MFTANELMHEIETLPSEYIQEAMNFIGYLKTKKARTISETMLMSEKTLSEIWDTPEEDETWGDL
jgi:hypothetical protein